MEEKKPSLWDKTKNWIMGITTLVVAGGGTAYVVNEISQDEHKDKTEKTVDPKTGRLTGFDIVQEKGRFTAYDEQGKEIGKLDSYQIVNKDDANDNSDWVYEPTPGTKEAFMAEESKKFMDNIKIERLDGNKSEKDIGTGGKAQRLTGMPIIPVIKKAKTEKQQTSEWRSGEVNGASVTYDKNTGFIKAAIGSRKQLESLGSYLSQEQMDSLDAENIKHLNERVSQNTWSATNSEDVHVRIVREGKKFEFPTADKNAIEVEGHQMSKGASIGYGKYEDPENDHYASFAGTKEDLQAKAQKKLADAIVEEILFGKHKKVTLADVRAKSENLQQKKNGTDTPAPESKVADDKNKEAVLPKQPQLTSVRSKGGRKGGEPLGA